MSRGSLRKQQCIQKLTGNKAACVVESTRRICIGQHHALEHMMEDDPSVLPTRAVSFDNVMMWSCGRYLELQRKLSLGQSAPGVLELVQQIVATNRRHLDLTNHNLMQCIRYDFTLILYQTTYLACYLRCQRQFLMPAMPAMLQKLLLPTSQRRCHETPRSLQSTLKASTKAHA
jgi:hypothetical protein